MPETTTSLGSIDECPDLMVDGVVLDENDTLIFLSTWGRDTAIQEFIARLQLGTQENGLPFFNLVTPAGTVPVEVGSIDRLEKASARAYQRTLFGSMTNLWLFDKRAIKPDKANASAIALIPQGEDATDRIWRLVREACPLPMLEHWRGKVIAEMNAGEMLKKLPFAFGPLVGWKIAIDVKELTERMSELIRYRHLAVEPHHHLERLAA
jgi:hypothetical protein